MSDPGRGATGDRGPGDIEPTLPDDPQARADAATVRSSSQRVRLSDPAVRAEVRRKKRRNNRIAGAAALVAVIAVLGYLAVYFLPVLAVRSVEVTGVPEEQQAEVVERASVSNGTPLLQVDSRNVAQRVSVIPNVSEVRVVREYPSTLRIEIVEREPAVVVEIDGSPHIFDREGVDYDQSGNVPEGLLRAELSEVSLEVAPQAVRDIVEITETLRTATMQAGAEQIATSVSSRSPQGYEVTLADGRVIEWGSVEKSAEKAASFAAVMDRPGQRWNVSNPSMPVSSE